jgi:protein involved in polysaccharide export with SLBB domain
VPISACHGDKRISLADLEKLERQIDEVTPTPVEHEKLALVDFRPYKLRQGDVLAIQMVGLLEDRYAPTMLQVRVQSDGCILLPAIDPVQVEGLALNEVEQAIIAAHVPDIVKNLSVYVQLVRPGPTTVLVLGAAGQPGLVKLDNNARNVLYALASAQGFGPLASGRVRMKPIRPEREEAVYDLTDVNDVRRALLGPPLESGDVLVAESADDSVVYVTGLVNQPRVIPVPPQKNLSVRRAIAASGGLVDFLEPQEATLWRQLRDGRQVQVRVDLAAIQSGEAADLALRAGDILHIPHTPETRFRQWLAGNIRIGPFGVTAVYDPVADYRTRILRERDYDDDLLTRTLLQNLGTGISELLIPPVPTPTAP